MLMRELSRIAILTILGFCVGLYMMISEDSSAGIMLIAPTYLLGMFYAGKTLLGMVATIAKTYFQCQIMSLFTNPLWGSIICIVLLLLGMAIVLSVGWIIGIGKCIYSLYVARQLDNQMV